MSVGVSIFLIVFLSIVIGYLIGSIMFADIFGYFLKKIQEIMAALILELQIQLECLVRNMDL